MSILNVSYYTSSQDKKPRIIPLEEVISDFKSGRYAAQIRHVREVLKQQGVDEYRAAKKTLPAIAFCGEFVGGHSKNNLVRSNDMLVFDIDHLSDNEMIEAKEKMSEDNYILAFWVSPSGNGYKGLIRISYLNVLEDSSLDVLYKKAFEIVTEYFHKQFDIDLDINCSDYSRICYVCWDENLFYNEHAETFSVDCSTVQQKKIYKPVDKGSVITVPHNVRCFKSVNVPGKNSQRSRKIVGSIIKYLSKRNLSITATYDEWLRVGFAIASTFNYDLGLKYYLALSRLDKGKFNEDQCIRKLQECYMTGTGEVTLGTIIDLAQKKGYEYKGSSEDS